MRAWRFHTAHRDDFGVHVSGQQDGDPLDMWMVEYIAKDKMVQVRKLTYIGDAPGLITNLADCPSLFNKSKKCTTHTHDEYEIETKIPVAYTPENVFKYYDEIRNLIDAIVKARWPHVEITT